MLIPQPPPAIILCFLCPGRLIHQPTPLRPPPQARATHRRHRLPQMEPFGSLMWIIKDGFQLQSFRCPRIRVNQVYAVAWAPNVGRPYELIAIATLKGISIWHLGSNPDPDEIAIDSLVIKDLDTFQELSMVASADLKHLNKLLDCVDYFDSQPHLLNICITLEEFLDFAEL